MRPISFESLFTITNRYNFGRDGGEVSINLTEMAGILEAECKEVDVSRYDDCISGGRCADCAEKCCLCISDRREGDKLSI